MVINHGDRTIDTSYPGKRGLWSKVPSDLNNHLPVNVQMRARKDGYSSGRVFNLASIGLGIITRPQKTFCLSIRRGTLSKK